LNVISYIVTIFHLIKIFYFKADLKSGETKKNMNICQKLKNVKMMDLIQKLRISLAQKVNAQINKYRLTLSDIHKVHIIFNTSYHKSLNYIKKFNFRLSTIYLIVYKKII
jgi:hypothetical protein